LLCFASFLILLGASSTPACSVPVFRYALERWAPASYEAIVFHRGPLTPPQSNLVSRLSGEALSNQPPANLTVTAVDLEAQPAPEMLEIWKPYQTHSPPFLVVRFPRGAPAEGSVWAGPLGETAVQELLESPTRKRIARSLLKGDSAVWLLLESGNKAADDEASRLLGTRLAHLQKTLKLPKIEAEDTRVVSVPESALKVGFSLLRLSRTDAAEAILVHCLLGTEDDLRDGRETMAFPVFGRGRALCALVGKGITAETIDDAGEFLVGPCSCVVKEQNPGLDLLLAVDWESQIRVLSNSDNEEPPPLTGLTTAIAATNVATTDVTVAEDRVAPDLVLLPAGPAPAPARPADAPPVANPLGLSLAVLGGLFVLVLALGTLLLRRRSRAVRPPRALH
jgi:hypothetical protein